MSNQDLHNLRKSHYTLEEPEISIALLTQPEEERRAKLAVIGDRFKTALPAKKDNTDDPDNYPMAAKNLMLDKRLRKDHESMPKFVT